MEEEGEEEPGGVGEGDDEEEEEVAGVAAAGEALGGVWESDWAEKKKIDNSLNQLA